MGIRDKGQHGLRSGSIHASEHSLPEKLSQALKALRPGALSQSSSSNSPFVSKSGVVDADDVIYYTNTDRFPSRDHSHQEKRTSRGRIFSNQRKSKSVFAKHSTGSNNELNAQFNHGVILNEVKSLDQIRHLYKSVPNVSSFEDDHYLQTPKMGSRYNDAASEGPTSSTASPIRQPKTAKSTHADAYITATSSSMSSLATSQSPTDSGYRSTSRHMLNGADIKPPPLPVNPPPNLTPLEHQSKKIARLEKEFASREKPHPKTDHHEKGSRLSLKEEQMFACSPVQINDLLETDRGTSEVLSEDIYGKRENCQMHSPVDALPAKIPFDERDVLTVIQHGKANRDDLLITLGVVKKLTAALSVPLLRICTEASRLAKPLLKCTMSNVRYATMLCLPESVAEECIKSAVQAATLYALSGTGALRTSMGRRSGLHFSVGNFYRWMIDSRISNIINDTAAIYLTAVMECILERLLTNISVEIGKSENVTEDNFDRLMSPHADICQFLQSCEVKSYKKSHKKIRSFVCAQSEAELRSLLDHLYRKLHATSTSLDQNSRRSKNALYFGKQAISSLFYFTRCRGPMCPCQDAAQSASQTSLYDWLRFILYFVDHRYGMHVDQNDVLQAARLLLPNVDCPPYPVDLIVISPSMPGSITDNQKRKQDIAFSLLLSAEQSFLTEAYQLLGNSRHKAMNDYGLTALAQAVITKNDDAISFLIGNNVDVNLSVPADNTNNSTSLSTEFSGWTPLSWSIANQDVFTVGKLLDSCADVDEVYMVHETPLQLATMIGDFDVFTRLISCGANAFSSTMNYDSMNTNFRSSGAPCALSVAAAFGRKKFMKVMLSQSSLSPPQQDMSLTDFLNEGNSDVRRKSSVSAAAAESGATSLNFQNLPKVIKKASQEAMYYAVETSRPGIAMELRRLGVPWNIYTWTRCLQTAYINNDRHVIQKVLKDFNTRLSDEITGEVIDETVAILFDVIRNESRQNDGNIQEMAQIISLLNEKFNKDAEYSDSISQTNQSTSMTESASNILASNRPMINPKYADNSELSDIRFKIDDKLIYAHRIVLVNASDGFKRLLDNPSGVIELDNVSYAVFKVLIDHMYGNKAQCYDKLVAEGLIFQLETMEASLTFRLDQLTQECYDLIKSERNNDNCIRVYRFAQRCGIQSLINDSEIYILQNFAALASNDQFRMMLQRSGQPGWCDMCASLANRLVEFYEASVTRQKMKRHC